MIRYGTLKTDIFGKLPSPEDVAALWTLPGPDGAEASAEWDAVHTGYSRWIDHVLGHVDAHPWTGEAPPIGGFVPAEGSNRSRETWGDTPEDTQKAVEAASTLRLFYALALPQTPDFLANLEANPGWTEAELDEELGFEGAALGAIEAALRTERWGWDAFYMPDFATDPGLSHWALFYGLAASPRTRAIWKELSNRRAGVAGSLATWDDVTRKMPEFASAMESWRACVVAADPSKDCGKGPLPSHFAAATGYEAPALAQTAATTAARGLAALSTLWLVFSLYDLVTRIAERA